MSKKIGISIGLIIVIVIFFLFGLRKHVSLPTDSKILIESKNRPTKQDSENIIKKSNIQDEIMSYRLKSKDKIQKTQIALKKAGFYAGEIDGRLGPKTKKAIKTFQRSRGLDPDGIIGPKTWGELNKVLKE